MIPVVHLVGYSNSGKTTVMSGLIRILKSRGYKVAAVKHAAHGYTPDPPGTDSWNYAQAGADQVAIVGPDSFTIHEFGRIDYPLAMILNRISEVDLILVEGFKNAPGPKIEIYRQGHSEDRMPRPKLAIVSDVLLEEEVPCFLFGELEKLADFIAASLISNR